MATVRKTVTFTAQHDKEIKAQIESGEFTNDSEYLRSLVRQDQAKNNDFIRLKSQLQEVRDSGISHKKVPDIMKEVEARMKKEGRL